MMAVQQQVALGGGLKELPLARGAILAMIHGYHHYHCCYDFDDDDDDDDDDDTCLRCLTGGKQEGGVGEQSCG